MNIEQLQEVLTHKPDEIVKQLKTTDYTSDIPKWSDLKKQYNPMEHNIFNSQKYPPKLNDNQQDDFKRTPLALQKLAVSRVAQSMFSNPVKRIFNQEIESDAADKAVDIFEEMYRTINYIDSENIERCKQLNACCQVATIWYAYDQKTVVENENIKLSLGHKTFSTMNGYDLYPIYDDNSNLIALSIGYKDIKNKEHVASYFNFPDKPKFIQFDNIEEWVINTEVSQDLAVFPVVYLSLKEPVWGGESGTALVEQLEEMESYQGLYIKRNALPTFTLDYGEIDKGSKSDEEESSNDSRRIIKVGRGGKMMDVTWKGADEAINSRYERLRNAFFEQIQVPDTSFANMIKSNTSAENKELIFADAKAKAKDLGGEWSRAFYEEAKIVKKFLEIIFSRYRNEFNTMSIRSVIQPYSISSRKEAAEYVAVAGDAMSIETKVRVLGEVDDINKEVDKINEENSTNANQII